MSAPLGNQNAVKSRLLHDVLRRAVIQDDRKRLERGIDKLLDLAADGDLMALTMIRDTLDGKPRQQTEVSGPDGGPITTQALHLDFSGRKLSDEA